MATGRTVWAMGDQGMVSLGNFAVNIILARNVTTTEFGIYTLVFSVFLFLNGMHGSFVNYPMTIRIAKGDALEVPRLVGMGMILTVVLLVPLGGAVAALFILLEQPQLIPYGLLSFVAWRFHDVMRRTLMAQLRFRAIVPGDAVSYLGQAVAMLGLIYFDRLSLEAVFLAMAGTSALAALIQAIQVKVRFSHPRAMVPFVKECWRLGRWVILHRLAAVIQMQAVGWMLAAVHGVEATANFRAVINVLAVTHPIMQGIGNLVVPSVVRAHRKGIMPAMRATAKLAAQGAVLVLPYFFTLALFPGYALGLIYGPDSPYQLMTDVLFILTMSYTINYFSRMVTGSLAGLAKPDIAFQVQLFGSVAALTISLPMAAWGGVYYAAIGALLSHIVRLCAGGYYLRRECIRESGDLSAKPALGDSR